MTDRAIHKRANGCAVVALALLTACGAQTSVDAAQPTSTQQRHQYWSSLSQNYEISFRQQCFCLPDYLRPMRIVVHQGEITAATFEDDNSTVPSLIVNDLQTVSEMFQSILQAESIPAENIRVEFDQQFHYPRTVQIDYDFRLSDDEVHWQFSRLEFSATQ